MRLFTVIMFADFIVFIAGALIFQNGWVGLNSAIGVTVGISAGAIWSKWLTTNRQCCDPECPEHVTRDDVQFPR